MTTRPFDMGEHVRAILNSATSDETVARQAKRENHYTASGAMSDRVVVGSFNKGEGLTIHDVGKLCADLGVTAYVFSYAGEPLCRIDANGDVIPLADPQDH